MNKIKCDICGWFFMIHELTWTKTWKITANLSQDDEKDVGSEAFLTYVRLEMIKSLEKDVEEGKNDGELWLCVGCYNANRS